MSGELILSGSPDSEIVSVADNHFYGLQQNPALQYIASLRSRLSQRVMFSFLSVLARHFGYTGVRDCDWTSLSNFHIQAFIAASLKEGRSPATINTYLAAIRGVARAAWRSKIASREYYDLVRDVKPVRGSRLAKTEVMSDDEVRALLQLCLSDPEPSGLRDAAIFSVATGCGLRRTELVSLSRSSVNMASGSLRVLGKGNKERQAFMPPSTIKMVREWMDFQRDYWHERSIFSSDSDTPLFPRIRRHSFITNDFMCSDSIRFLLSKRLSEAGLEGKNPHILRHTFATKLLDNGEDIFTVKEAMGHSNIATTQRYDRRGLKKVIDAASRLDFGL